MESSESSPFDSFKSKKVFHSVSKSSQSDQTTRASDQNPWSSKTPEKPTDPPRRARNHLTAMSIKEVKQFAKGLQKSNQDRPIRSDQISSARQQIALQRSKSPAAKSKKVDSSMKLPEKYEILSKFFDSLDCSIRLLRLKGMVSTFTNISPKIEYLTDRRFSQGHLAQLKFILPEVIEINKVRIHNEHTDCKTSDLHVTLNVDAIGNDGKLKTDSGSSHARKAFRARLMDFFKSHPEGDEVPEEALLEPFNQSKPGAPSEHHPAAPASHLSQSFQRRFSQKGSCPEASKTNQKPSTAPLQPSVLPVLGLQLDQNSKEETTASAAPSPIKFSLNSTTSGKCLESRASLTCQSSSRVPTTPIKERDSTKTEDCSSMGTDTIQFTPAKLASTPAKLMNTTPALQPPKRSCMSPDDDSTSSPVKLVRRPPRSRSLKFDTPVKNAKVDEVDEIGGLSDDNDIFEILPESLLQSIREKERKSIEDKDPAISQAKWRRQMIASLPRLFDMIRLLFQSINRSLITKEELIHRIVACHMDIVDRREVEEQLRLLQEIVPEYIYEKVASTGDILICVNKISCPEAMRAALAEVK
ncbi:CDT1-like protein a, chloroplastic [Cornus florida]|uniref:CDT1-like protein a, chloroplastic n=1 Tax=Cornus florida TaxID=4283 RepID=UPI002896A412|nr:CDT1-like protein a, chloroplastic [Cornus florida]